MGATVAGVTNNLQQSDNKHISTPLVTDSLFYGSMNLLMYNSGFSYPQMIMTNLLAYPIRNQAFLGGFGQIMGGMLGTFLGGRKMGVNVGISAEPIIVKIDPASFGTVIAEASKQAKFVVDKIEQAEENLVMLSFEQGRIALKEVGGIVQIIVDNAIADAFKGAQLTIENFGNILQARIDQGAQEAKIIINYIPFIAKQTSESIVEGFTHSLLQSFWYSYFRHIENEIKNYVLKTQDPNLIKLLINFVWIQRIRPEFSAQDKENLYKQLLIIVNNPANPIEKLREMFLLIGYTAIHDPSMQVLSSSLWPFSSTNHTKNIIAAIPDPIVWNMLDNLDYKAIHQIFPAIKIIRETLLLPDNINLNTDIDNANNNPYSPTKKVEFLPIGAVIACAHENIPDGYLVCDGKEYKKSEYPELAHVLNYKYGQRFIGTDLYFNVPDYRGYFLRALDDGAELDLERSSRSDRGDGVCGDKIGTKQEDSTRMPRIKFSITDAGAHKHSITEAGQHTHFLSESGRHNHMYRSSHQGWCPGYGKAGTAEHMKDDMITGAAGEHTHNMEAAGSHTHDMDQASLHTHEIIGGDKETRPKNVNVIYIMKARPERIDLDKLKNNLNTQNQKINSTIVAGTIAVFSGCFISFKLYKMNYDLRAKLEKFYEESKIASLNTPKATKQS